MRRLAPFALALALAFPACAQRGGGHSGFVSHSASSFHSFHSFHSAPAFHSSFAPSSAYRYAGGPLVRSPYGYASSVRTLSTISRYAPGISTVRPAFYQRDRALPQRRRFYSNRGLGFYSYPVVVAPGYLPYAYADDYADDDLDQPNDDEAAYGPEAAPPPGIDNGYPEPPPQYQPDSQYEPAPPQPAPSPQTAPVPADTVTLIFKDGRPPEQIQNYLATRSTLTVIDGEHHRDIPLADLNIPATLKANSDTGVGFQLPPGQ